MLKNEEAMQFTVMLSFAVALLASVVGTEEVPEVPKQSGDPAELTWAALEKFHQEHHKTKHHAHRHNRRLGLLSSHNSSQEREVHGHHHKHHHKHQGGLVSAQDWVAAARKQSKSASAEEAELDWPSLFDVDMYGAKKAKSKKTKKHEAEDGAGGAEAKVEVEDDNKKTKDDKKEKDDEDRDLDEDDDEAEPKPVKKHAVKKSPKNAKPQKTEVKKVEVKTQAAKTSKDDEDDEEAPVVDRDSDVSEPQLPFGDMEPFGREATAQHLTEDSIMQSNAMVDQIEKAELAEEQRSVFRALTRLRGAALASFDGIARSATGNIQEYATRNQWRDNHPVTHLAEEEGDVEKWAFPSNAD